MELTNQFKSQFSHEDVKRLTNVLLARGLITPKDTDYVVGKISYEDWHPYVKRSKTHTQEDN